MTKDEAIQHLRKGNVVTWNLYRESHKDWKPDLSDTDLSTITLAPPHGVFNLSNANLCGAKLPTLGQRWVLTNIKGAIYDKDTSSDWDLAKCGATFMSDPNRDRIRDTLIFISYAWADDGPVLAIDQWLRNKDLETKIDKRDFFAGEHIRHEILRVMERANVILIFYSAQSAEKPWPEFERELAEDLKMEAKIENRDPPRVIYVVIDDTPLPSVIERSRIAVMAKGKPFEDVCGELYHHILQLPQQEGDINLDDWKKFVF